VTYIVDTEEKIIYGEFNEDFTLVVGSRPSNTQRAGCIAVEVWHTPTANMITEYRLYNFSIEPDIDLSKPVWADFMHGKVTVAERRNKTKQYLEKHKDAFKEIN